LQIPFLDFPALPNFLPTTTNHGDQASNDIPISNDLQMSNDYDLQMTNEMQMSNEIQISNDLRMCAQEIAALRLATANLTLRLDVLSQSIQTVFASKESII